MRIHRLSRFALLSFLLLVNSALVPAAEDAIRKFNIPAESAENSLKQFADQATRSVMYATDRVAGVRTNRVQGEMPVGEALNLLLSGTALYAVPEAQTGGFAIARHAVTRESREPLDQGKSLAPPRLPDPPGARASMRRGDDEAVTMTAFQVEADPDSSYGALNSNSITQFKQELFKLPVTADIYTETFMKDISATSVESMIMDYNPGSGIALTAPQAVPVVESYERLADSSVSIRGLYTPNYQRDGLIPLNTYSTSSTTGTGFSSNFDLERVEILKGPQSMLYGSGGGGGVMNMVSKQARLGKPAFGSLRFTVDQYGHKLGQLDYGAGNQQVAARVALIRQTTGARRVDIGGPLQGYYGQLAFRLPHGTVVRVLGNWTRYRTFVPFSATLTAVSAANDARNGLSLQYLLATDQIQASANGRPSGAGVIGNGKITWDNVNSYGGDQRQEFTKDSFASIAVESKWTAWLATQFAAGYKDYMTRYSAASSGLIAPNVASNPLGVWAGQRAGAAEDRRGAKTKAIRFAAYTDHRLFGDRIRSQSVLGTDYSRVTPSFESFLYYRKGTSPLGTPKLTIPTAYYSVADGPVKYPVPWQAFAQTVVANGEEYFMASQNPPDSTKISPTNPLGLVPGGGSFYRLKTLSWGTYGANSMEFWDGRLATLAGFRLASYKQQMLYNGVAPQAGDPNTYPSIVNEKRNKLSLEVGANYALRPWLRPYVAISSSYNPTLVQRFGPVGDVPASGEALGGEAGLKVQNGSGAISGSLAAFHVQGKNELLQTSLRTFINPTGLNGDQGAPGGYFNGDRTVRGLEANLTAAPSRGWRLRFAGAWTDGRISSTKVYQQVYNDQFYQNGTGQVTYKDGTVVYVNPTAINAATPAVAASAPGAIPLTIAAMSSPTNLYYANPAPVTGQINTSSNAARVLRVIDPLHGPVLTGANGLPMSAMQINPGFTPPGSIVVGEAGDVTSNHAEYSFNVTNMYTFTSGWLRRFRIGGTAAFAWKNRGYYYYPTTDTSPTAPRSFYYRPDVANFNLIAGYSFKLGRYTLSTQMNISNLLNHYRVLILPAAIGGFPAATMAGFSRDPRSLNWSNSLEF